MARITAAARVFNPDIPVVLVAPGIHNSPDYPSDRHHEPALVAARQWVTRNGTGLVETDALCLPSLQDGSANPDGIHYSWQTHQLIGDAVAAELRVVGFNPAAGSLALSGE
ncbi:MAG: hypothetical protein ACJAY5_001873 [Actinomycetes bacterium]